MTQTPQRSHHRILPSSAFLVIAFLLSHTSIAAPVKVAFVGDQGVGEHAQAVLSLIATEGTDLLLIQGDLGYGENSAATWEANLSNALGADFPVLTVVGNHENFEWPSYQSLIQSRVDRASGLSCTGETGVKALCRFENIEIVQVSPGISEVQGVKPDDYYAEFIASSFSDSTAPWRICSWHKNQSKLQTGSKSDATGWDVYDACLNAGAMVALAHEHAYSRTYLLSDFRNQTVVHKNNEMTLESGRSFAFVSGLGGREVREQSQGGDWWASIYTATQGAAHGALFCTFDEVTANCYFKAIDGAVPDQFSLRSGTGSTQGGERIAESRPLPAAEIQPLAIVQTEPEPEPEPGVGVGVIENNIPLDSIIVAGDLLATSVVDATTPMAQQPVPETAFYSPSPPPRQASAAPLATEPADSLSTTASGRLSLGLLITLLCQCAVRRVSQCTRCMR